VKEGETASDIAGLFYRDPTRWRPIAIANELENPRRLRAGQMLVIPALE
jgi:nucleoid-associated protein YgaU